ncbi:Uncharacterised protein [Escherichia coli]|uniref:Lipoprotein n=1 Tax=Escherichia coli TaxID=562 RepID=A0A1V2GCL3_ECOLX|nr:hypothetical protein BWR13_15835 [Escherichia coli]ONG32789.1 hypothetical protein BXT93_19535 [Escherichia coli]OWH15174.1 hypothetical protein CCE14_18400 [Escherichia coli]PBU24299.1 hypothetical protein BB539_09915 [Escherichia coli]PWH37685.1 hypothetical protein DD768_16725 [Escherichia coli]
MKKFFLLAALVLAGCSNTTYTEATHPNGTTVKHISIAPGTKSTTASGGCIDSTGAAASCPLDQ